MTCSIEACDRPLRSGRAQWCEMHYYRNRRHGDPLVVHPNAQYRRPCQMVDCERAAHTLGWCKSHYDKAYRHGNPIGRMDVGYGAAHDRVRRVRGSARSHSCARCGVPARQWSYMHTDPDERIEQGMRYSPDPSFYEPLCVPCHKRVDLARIHEHPTEAKSLGLLL